VLGGEDGVAKPLEARGGTDALLLGCGSFRFSYFCEIQGQLAGARSVTTPLFS
jgi:hypothetical protein